MLTLMVTSDDSDDNKTNDNNDYNANKSYAKLIKDGKVRTAA